MNSKGSYRFQVQGRVKPPKEDTSSKIKRVLNSLSFPFLPPNNIQDIVNLYIKI